jgi:hypothetical protein
MFIYKIMFVSSKKFGAVYYINNILIFFNVVVETENPTLVNYGCSLAVMCHSKHAKTLGWNGTDLN